VETVRVAEGQHPIIKWAITILEEQEYKVFSWETVKNSSYSVVLRFNTTKGLVYLKHMARNYSHEPEIIKFLNAKGIQNLPNIIAANQQERAFLSTDAGQPLAKNPQQEGDNIYMTRTILELLASFQQSCTPHTEALIGKGMNDWRVHKFPELYAELLSKEQLLSSVVSVNEIRALHNLCMNFILMSKRLADLPPAPTIEHGDYHSSNILIKDGNITISDFGDSVISHPFFSIRSFERHIRHNTNITSPQLESLMDSYGYKWPASLGYHLLAEAWDMTTRLEPFTKILQNLRCLDSMKEQESTYLSIQSSTLLKNKNYSFLIKHALLQKIAEEIKILINFMTEYRCQ